MATGDHIYCNCSMYAHHGIDCGNDTVIHYEGKHQSGRITRVSKSSFCAGQTVFVMKYEDCAPPSVVVARAESKLGEPDYNLFGNNCEHFAHWCKTGEKASEQMGTAILLTLIGSVGVVGVAGAFVSIGTIPLLGIGAAIGLGSTILDNFFTGEAKYDLDEMYEDFEARYHLENIDEE